MPELPEMKVLNIADKSFKVVDAAAQDHLLTHDEQIQQILDNDVVNKNMLINSDFIANFNDPNDDLNLSGWKITASSTNKPSLIGSMGLMIQPNMTDVKIYTPSWHAQWLSSGDLDLLGFPITLSVEYRIGSLGDIRTASVTFNSSANSDVNLAEIEEGVYLKVKMFGSDSQSDGTQSCFYMSDTLSTNMFCIRRIKIERSEMATGFDQSMNDLALLKVAKEMADDMIKEALATTSPVSAPLQNVSTSTGATETLWYWKSGKTVTINIDVIVANAGVESIITTLPTGFKPPRNITSQLKATGSTQSTRYITILSDGSVRIYADAVRILDCISFVAGDL